MTTRVTNKEWMLPVEALQRFNPPASIRFSSDSTEMEYSVRYGYRIGNYGFLIEKDSLSEVVEDQSIFKIPLTSPVLKGMLNLRGNLVPVFDMEKLLTDDAGSRERSIVLVIGDSGNEVGLLIDEYPKPVYETGTVGQLPGFPPEFTDFISYGINQAGMDWVEFDCQAFFKSFSETRAA